MTDKEQAVYVAAFAVAEELFQNGNDAERLYDGAVCRTRFTTGRGALSSSDGNLRTYALPCKTGGVRSFTR